MNLFVFFGLLLGLCVVNAANNTIVFCYYGSWATYRNGNGKFDVNQINPNLCTHIAYSFAGVNLQGSIISLDSYLDLTSGLDNFRKFVALKKINPNLKTVLAVGGWNEGSSKYSMLAANPTLRANFIQSSLKIILDHGFDGLDLDWEYPNQRDTVYGAADVGNFNLLVQELRTAFDVHGLILTAAVAAVKSSASLSYDVPTISKYLDYINVMTYDMYGAWDPVTGHNAPLYEGEGDENQSTDSLFTVDNAIKFWINAGAPPEKLVLGVPFYGRSFTLSNANRNTVRSPASGPGISGPYTFTNGFLGYNEICTMINTEPWTVNLDVEAQVPYAYSGLNWISYDDPKSITLKTEYAMKYNLGGIMMWSIETDDSHGDCGSGDFPLLRAINNALGKNVPAPTTTPASSSIITVTSSTNPQTSTTSSSITEVTTASAPPEDFVCKNEGFAANPANCNTYFICVKNGSGNLIAFKFKCPSNLRWDQSVYICNYPEQVKC